MTSPILEKRLRPRKVPSQSRAEQTRTRILDAARSVFATYGYAAGTTNRIAEAAGLSVGSLYQYFPNKDAILVELVRAHVDEGTDRILAAVGPADPTSPANPTGLPNPTSEDDSRDELYALVGRVVAAMADLHARDRRLHRVLFEESPRPPSLLAEVADLEDRAVELVAARLNAHRPDPDRVELAARLVVVTIESLVHRLVASDRPLDLDRFIQEATTLVTAYLRTVIEPSGS